MTTKKKLRRKRAPPQMGESFHDRETRLKKERLWQRRLDYLGAPKEEPDKANSCNKCEQNGELPCENCIDRFYSPDDILDFYASKAEYGVATNVGLSTAAIYFSPQDYKLIYHLHDFVPTKSLD